MGRTIDDVDWVTAADAPQPLTVEQVEDALMRTATGSFKEEASVMLLGWHDYWLRNGDFRQYLLMLDDDQPDRAFNEPMWIRVDWPGAIAAVNAGGAMGGSGTAVRILRIAASIGGGVLVDLSEALSGFDNTNLRLVHAAVTHAVRGRAEAAHLWPERP